MSNVDRKRRRRHSILHIGTQIVLDDFTCHLSCVKLQAKSGQCPHLLHFSILAWRSSACVRARVNLSVNRLITRHMYEWFQTTFKGGICKWKKVNRTFWHKSNRLIIPIPTNKSHSMSGVHCVQWRNKFHFYNCRRVCTLKIWGKKIGANNSASSENASNRFVSSH